MTKQELWKEYYKTNRERILENKKRYVARNRQKVRSCQRRWRATVRQQVFEHYGYSCYCCGEDSQEMLTLDHIDQDGAEHRRQIGSGGFNLWKWVRDNGFPDNFRIACFNCNTSAYRNGGVCSHQKEE